MILVYKENVHWFRNIFELVQLRQILEASCGYAMNFGLVRQERNWKINKYDMFYEHLKQFWVWCPVDWQPKATRGSYALKTWQQATRGFIPYRPATSKATRGSSDLCRLATQATRGYFPCRHGISKVTRGKVLKIKCSYMFRIVFAILCKSMR